MIVCKVLQHDWNGNCWHLSLLNPIASIAKQQWYPFALANTNHAENIRRAGAMRRGDENATLGRVSNNPPSLISRRRRAEHPLETCDSAMP